MAIPHPTIKLTSFTACLLRIYRQYGVGRLQACGVPDVFGLIS